MYPPTSAITPKNQGPGVYSFPMPRLRIDVHANRWISSLLGKFANDATKE